MVVASLLAFGPASSAQDAASPSDVASTEGEAGYDKGFFIRSADGDFTLRPQGVLQPQLQLESVDEPDKRDTDQAFLLRRARLIFSGHAYDRDLSWKFQADFGQGAVSLKDFYVDYAAVPGTLHLRAGQWKRPFSRQFLISGTRQEFVDRAITSKASGASRDVGVAVHNGSPAGFEYALGVFNGTGDGGRLSGVVVVDPATGEGDIESGKFSNVPDKFHPAVVARVGFNGEGMKGYSEADLEGGPARFAVGASSLLDLDADGDDVSGLRGEVDYVLKVHGFSTTGAAYASTAQDGAGLGDQSLDSLGFHVQAGYVLGERYQPAVRYALVAPNGADNNEQEIAAAFSVYFFGHNLKLQTDAAALTHEDPQGGRSDYRVRTLLQLAY